MSVLSGAIKYFESMEFDTCCSGRDCGCMGKPIDPEYYILQDMIKAEAQLAKKDEIIAELKRAVEFYRNPANWDNGLGYTYTTIARDYGDDVKGTCKGVVIGGKLAREVAEKVRGIEDGK